MQNNLSNERKFYISMLSVFSIVAVVFLHTNGQFWTFSKEHYWFLENINECIFYFAVPAFFMISGITLFDYTKKYSTLVYFKKRISKTLIPFVFWSLFGLVFSIYVLNEAVVDKINFTYIINGLLNTNFVDVYWFFIPLFKIYIIIPIFANLNEAIKDKLLFFLLIIMLCFNSIFPFLISLFHIPIFFFEPFVLGDYFICYSIIGYLSDKYYEKIFKKNNVFMFFTFLAIGAFCCHLFGTYFSSVKANELVMTFKGYMNILCVIYTFWIYLLTRKLEFVFKKNKKLSFAIEFLSKYTFAIYLLHIFVLKYIIEVFIPDMNNAIIRWGLPFVIIPICVIIAFVLRKNRILKRIIP